MIKRLLNTNLLILMSLLICINCKGAAVAREKEDYIGDWESVGVFLQIRKDGFFFYKYKETEEGGPFMLRGAIKSMDDNSLTAGVFLVTPTFSIEKAPYYDKKERVWKMKFDGFELVRRSSYYDF